MGHFRRALHAGAALLVLWAGAGHAQTDVAPVGEDSLRPVRVQLKWAHQFQFAGFYAAIHNGYYRDLGLEVLLYEYAPSRTPIDQLLGGRVEFAVADSGALIYRSTGVPLVALAAIMQVSPSVLISRADGDIHSLEDLRGQRVMLAGGYLNAELMAMLRAAGLGADDIELVPTEVSLDALVDGRIAAFNGYSTNEPLTLQELDVPVRIFEPMDYGVDFYGDILVTTETVLAADPDMVRNFRAATLRGWAWALANREQAVDLILEHYNTQGKTREQLMFEANETARLTLHNVVPLGYMNLERWQRIAELFRAHGMIQGGVDLTAFVYGANKDLSLAEFLELHRFRILFIGLMLLAMLMAAHAHQLRHQVRARTHELEQSRLRAEDEARTDALTGLPNRRYLFEQISRDLARAERDGLPLAVITVDLDRFKQVNDCHGHAGGDEALRAVAGVVRSHTRFGDFAARLGGEEFAMTCLNSDAYTARALAERLRAQVEGLQIISGDTRFRITLSAGVAQYRPGDTVDSLLRRADQALYAAKTSGRNRVCG